WATAGWRDAGASACARCSPSCGRFCRAIRHTPGSGGPRLCSGRRDSESGRRDSEAMSTDRDGGPRGEDRLRVSILGPVRAWHGHRELPLGPARQRAVFAVLAAAGRTVGREELIDAVWEATPPSTAGGSIYTYISGLRRSL